MKMNQFQIQKKGKTEVVIFGTVKYLSMISKSISVKYNGIIINNVTTYKYLHNVLDSYLNLNHNFKMTYRKAGGRHHLLSKMRYYLTNFAAMKIYICRYEDI